MRDLQLYVHRGMLQRNRSTASKKNQKCRIRCNTAQKTVQDSLQRTAQDSLCPAARGIFISSACRLGQTNFWNIPGQAGYGLNTAVGRAADQFYKYCRLTPTIGTISIDFFYSIIVYSNSILIFIVVFVLRSDPDGINSQGWGQFRLELELELELRQKGQNWNWSWN